MKQQINNIKQKFADATLRLKSQAKLDEALVQALIVQKDGPQIEKLLKAGANPNTSNGLPLDIAVSSKNTTAMYVLLSAGAKVDIDDNRPLRVAITEGKSEIAFELMRRGAKATDLLASLDDKNDRSREATRIREWVGQRAKAVERIERQVAAKAAAATPNPTFSV